MDLIDEIHGIDKSHKKHKTNWMKIHSSECEEPIYTFLLILMELKQTRK